MRIRLDICCGGSRLGAGGLSGDGLSVQEQETTVIDSLPLLAMVGGIVALVVVSVIAVGTFHQTLKRIGGRRRVVRHRLPRT
jgi:hypothetical protein